MNPNLTPCAAPPGYYGGPYLPTFNQGQFGYPNPCTPAHGNYNVPFSGYGGPYIQPFFGPPQPCPSIPYAYGPYPGMFPPGYMVPQQGYPQPCMYGGPPMPPAPVIHSLDGGAVQSPAVSTNEIPDNSQNQQQSDDSTLMRFGDASGCTSDLHASFHQQQQMSTVSSKCPPGFPQIPSGDVSPAGMQWNTKVSHADLHVPGISQSEDTEDRDDSEGSSCELWPPSSEQSSAGCQTTPDTDYTSDCQQPPDLTSDTQPSRSDALSEHSNDSDVNAQTVSNLQKPSCEELVTDQNKIAASTLCIPPIQDEELVAKEEIGKRVLVSFTKVSKEAMSAPATTVYLYTTGSDSKDGTTRFTWNAANKDLPFIYRECLVGVFQYVDSGLCIPSGLSLENKCWAVPWLNVMM